MSTLRDGPTAVERHDPTHLICFAALVAIAALGTSHIQLTTPCHSGLSPTLRSRMLGVCQHRPCELHRTPFRCSTRGACNRSSDAQLQWSIRVENEGSGVHCECRHNSTKSHCSISMCTTPPAPAPQLIKQARSLYDHASRMIHSVRIDIRAHGPSMSQNSYIGPADPDTRRESSSKNSNRSAHAAPTFRTLRPTKDIGM
jgi:hypothetical protein